MAKIACAETLDFQGIARQAGSSCDETIRFDGEYLYVSDVTQDALAAAFYAFDPLPRAKARALVRINQDYESEFAAIKSEYPDVERETWSLQLREADAYTADPNAGTPFLDMLLISRGFGETKEELITKVRTKSATYATLSASLTGRRHALERQIQNANISELDLILW